MQTFPSPQQAVTVFLQMLKKHPIKNPLRSLGLGVPFFYTDTIPTGFKRGFEVFEVSAEETIRLGMQVATPLYPALEETPQQKHPHIPPYQGGRGRRVRRKTETTRG